MSAPTTVPKPSASARSHVYGSIFTADSSYSTTTDARGVVHVIQTHGTPAAVAAHPEKYPVIDYGV